MKLQHRYRLPTVKVESEIFDCRVRKMHKVYCRNTDLVSRY